MLDGLGLDLLQNSAPVQATIWQIPPAATGWGRLMVVPVSVLLGITSQGPSEGPDLFGPFSCPIVVGPVRLEVCDPR